MILPFLGSREDDFTPFQYLLVDLSLNGAKILVPNWVVRREWLRRGDEVHFHAPFKFAGETYTTGQIMWSRWEQETNAQSCGVSFAVRAPALYPVAISFDEQDLAVDLSDFARPEGLLRLVLKDAILLKRGILIYLKHLAPYLSRTSGVGSEQYLFLRSFLFEDAARRIVEHQAYLEALAEQLRTQNTNQADLLRFLDVEEVLEVLEPEIPADVFSLAFDREVAGSYIQSIKTLEQKLYTTYNTLIMLYLHDIHIQ